MQSHKCQICDQPSEEIKILLQGLKKRLINKNKKEDQQYQEMKSDQKNSQKEVFTRMVDIVVFGHGSSSIGCSHKKTYRQFYRKMRCTQAKFKQNCQQVLLQVASKCYQLDVVLQQISLLEDRVLEVTKLPMFQGHSKQHQSRKNHFESSDPSHRSIKSQNLQKNINPHESQREKKGSISGAVKGASFQMPAEGQGTFFYLSFYIPNFNDN